MEGWLQAASDRSTPAVEPAVWPCALLIEPLEDRRLMSATPFAHHPPSFPCRFGVHAALAHGAPRQAPTPGFDRVFSAIRNADLDEVHFARDVVRGGGVFIGIQSPTSPGIESPVPTSPPGASFVEVVAIGQFLTSPAPISARGADGRLIMTTPRADQNQGKDHDHRPPRYKPAIDPGGTVEDAPGPALTPLAQAPASARAVAPGIALPARPGEIAVTARSPAASSMAGSNFTASVPIAPTRLAVEVMEIPSAEIAGSSAVVAPTVAGAVVHIPGISATDLPLAPVVEDAPTRYNFVRFDPAALLNDTAARFINESASLGIADLAMNSRSRAWVITGAVIAIDALFLGYWLGRRRDPVGNRPWGDHIEICPRLRG